MSKKAVLEMSVGTIMAIFIFIIFIIVAVPKVKDIIGLSSSQQKDFQSFSSLIDRVNENFKTKGQADSIIINLEKDAALLGFARSANKINLHCGGNIPLCDVKNFRIGQELSDQGASIERPASCLNDQSCFCICKKGFKSGTASDFCDKADLQCVSKDVDILGIVSGKDFRQDLGDGGYFINGFLISKASTRYPLYNQASYSITVMKAKTKTVAICLREDGSCLAEYEPRVRAKCPTYDSDSKCRADPDCAWSKDICEPKFV